MDDAEEPERMLRRPGETLLEVAWEGRIRCMTWEDEYKQ